MGIEMELSRVKMYSVYRNDKINNYTNLAAERLQMHERGKRREICRDWNQPQVTLDFLGPETFDHHKIMLDVQSGERQYVLP